MQGQTGPNQYSPSTSNLEHKKKKRIQTRICFLRENRCLPPIGVMQFHTESQVLVQQWGINSKSKYGTYTCKIHEMLNLHF